MDELLLISPRGLDFPRSATLCFTEAGISKHILDSTFLIQGFQLFREDCVVVSGKKRGMYARILFEDFRSAYNIINPHILHQKLTQLTVAASTCQWILVYTTHTTSHHNPHTTTN
ncbi:hypothetical protein CRENBAI_005127 [Crenichthys baileyi]|uniref:Uncharacterized protein n=1 Tax=Crenichthys baileyi TaxID=28760 RepID=A0AAV9SCJ7_9TELE